MRIQFLLMTLFFAFPAFSGVSNFTGNVSLILLESNIDQQERSKANIQLSINQIEIYELDESNEEFHLIGLKFKFLDRINNNYGFRKLKTPVFHVIESRSPPPKAA